MHTHAVALLQLETDLRRAIERQEFQIYYQPIMSLETGRIVGFEALRWQHHSKAWFLSRVYSISRRNWTHYPDWAVGAPRSLLPDAGMADAVSQSPPVISVNLSVKQFSQPDLIEQIVRFSGKVA